MASIGRLPNLTHLRYFLAVADCLSFRQASERLSIAQPAVTRAVQLLESELGYRLLERSTRRVSLTPAGEYLRGQAQLALVNLSAAVHDARQYDMGVAGELAIGYAGIAPMLATSCATNFRSMHPDTRLVMYMRTSDECSTLLQAGHLDVAFILSAACSSPLRHRVVRRHQFVAVMAATNPLSNRQTLQLCELAESNFIMGGQSRIRLFATLVERACRDAGFSPKVVDEANDTTLMMQLVAEGRGVTLYSPEFVSQLPPGLKAIPTIDEFAGYEVSVAWSAQRETPSVMRFVDSVASINTPTASNTTPQE